MADIFENPMGLMGFEFIELASPTPGVLEPVFQILGSPRWPPTVPRMCTCTDKAAST